MADYGWRMRPKIFHTNPTMMKLGTVVAYLEKIKKIYESRDISLESSWHQHFFTGNQQLLCYIKKYRYGFHLKT